MSNVVDGDIAAAVAQIVVDNEAPDELNGRTHNDFERLDDSDDEDEDEGEDEDGQQQGDDGAEDGGPRRGAE